MEYRHIGELTPDGTVYVNDDMGTLEASSRSGASGTGKRRYALCLVCGFL